MKKSQNAKLLLAWLLLTSFCQAADLRQYGARYDDSSASAIMANDAAVIDLQSRLPLSGGSIDLQPGELHISKTIKNPTRWQATGAQAWRPINFAIDGKINSRIVWHGDPAGPAIDFQPAYPANYPDRNVRLRLQSLTLDGGGINLYGGGKFTTLRELRITNAQTPINAKYFDGGCLDDVYCYLNKGPARFDTCMLLQLVRFSVRESLGDGLLVTNCGAWSGQLYLESNIGWQGDFAGLKRSHLEVWIEDHGRGPFRPLVRRRDCQHNLWAGMVQDDQAWDDDPISRQLNRTVTGESEWPPLGEPVGKAADFAAYSGGPLFSQDGLTAVCKPGCFGRPTQCQGELRGFDDTYSHAWKSGDYLECELDVVCDEATRAFCGSALPFFINTAGGTFPDCKQNIRIQGERTHVKFRGAADRDGKGVRLFVTLLAMPSNAAEMRFRFEGLQVRHLANH